MLFKKLDRIAGKVGFTALGCALMLFGASLVKSAFEIEVNK